MMCAAPAKATSAAARLPASNRLEMLSGHSGPHRRLAGGRLGGIGDGGQDLVVDLDQFGGVLGLSQGLGDHDGDRLADKAHPFARQPEMRAREHR